jgi:hypothetical protein
MGIVIENQYTDLSSGSRDRSRAHYRSIALGGVKGRGKY